MPSRFQQPIRARKSKEVSMLKKKRVLIALMLVLTLTNLAITFYSQARQDSRQDSSKDIERVEKSRGRFPIADYEAAGPAEPDKRAKMATRNQRHNNSRLGVHGGANEKATWVTEVVENNDWEAKVPRIPTVQSDIVLVGEVLDANAYVSGDKNDVYSEFNVRVEDTIKNETGSAIPAGEVISVKREGGRVRYPSGQIIWFRISSQDMPEVSRRYVFFLKRVDEDSLSILTGYELRDGIVHPLDSGASQFAFYDGTDEASFLKMVRKGINTKQRNSHAKPQ
jgi:hypothetical protein